MKTMKTIRPLTLWLAIAAATWAGLATAQETQAPARKAPQPRCAVNAGDKAPAFEARTVDGATIKFPGDYKGKVVLLDFWATWCGPCRQELPNVVAAYQRFHPNGFEVLSVSLDKPQQGPALLQFVQANKMTWKQIYDGGFWKAAVAVQYGVRSIPCPVLVDGDTGNVLAVGPSAVGQRLTRVVETALAAKNKK